MFPQGKFKASIHTQTPVQTEVLLECLASPRRFTLISAPAGYGKSTFAWRLVEAQQHTAKTWIALDERDNDPGRFFSLLAVGLIKLADENYRPSDSDPYYEADVRKLLHLCEAQLERIDIIDKPRTLILDDFHCIQHDSILEHLEFFLKHWPQNLQLVITSRHAIPLKFGQGLLDDTVKAVDARQLCFSEHDIEQLLSLASKDSIEEGIAEQIVEITGGWPVAVQLALRTLKSFDALKHPDILANYKENIARYFWEQIYSDLADDVRETLLAASMCDSFHPDLLEAIICQKNTGESLKVLLENNLITHYSSGQPNWFRIHALLREFIQSEFELLPFDRKFEMRSTAISWLAEHEHLDDALNLALTHRQYNNIALILKQHGEVYLNQGSFEFLNYWIEVLPESKVYEDPALLLLKVWALPENQKVVQADILLARVDSLAEHYEKQVGLPHAELQAIYVVKVRALALKGYISRITNRYGEAVRFSHLAVELANKYHPSLLSRLYTTLGQDLYLHGDVMESEVALKKAIGFGKQYEKPHDVLIALGYLISSITLTGRFQDAVSMFTQTNTWFESIGFLNLPQSSMLDVLLIDVYREMGELQKADELSRKMIHYCSRTAPALHHLVTFIREYRLQLSQGNIASAGAALIEAESYKDILGVSWAFGWEPLEAMRAEYDMLRGLMAAANDWFPAREANLLASETCIDEFERFILCQWYVQRGELELAVNELKRIEFNAQVQNRTYHVIKAKIRQACLLSESDPTVSSQALIDAVVLCGESSYSAVFLDEGTQVIELLKTIRPMLIKNREAVACIDRLFAHAEERWPVEAKGASQNRLSILSDRQLCIMKLLVEGDQDKIIARKLDISPGTVKTHLRAIYRKLQCANRSQAVSIALEDGLNLIKANLTE